MECMSFSHSQTMVDFWGRLIDWKRRRKAENGFLEDTLRRFNARRVFDACLGDGCDSIHLLKNGFEVTSNDIDLRFIRKAQQNAREHNVRLNVTSFDWRKLDRHFQASQFDAVLCLGNSLTYLFSKKDRLAALSNFNGLLKDSGVLLIDQRNYDSILKNPKQMLDSSFAFKNRAVVCGKGVRVHPLRISSHKVTMGYLDLLTGHSASLDLYPFKNGEMESLLDASGFQVEQTLFDYSAIRRKDCEFITYVARKVAL